MAKATPAASTDAPKSDAAELAAPAAPKKARKAKKPDAPKSDVKTAAEEKPGDFEKMLYGPKGHQTKVVQDADEQAKWEKKGYTEHPQVEPSAHGKVFGRVAPDA